MKHPWDLKRVTALATMLFGLVTLAMAGGAFYLQHNWFWKELDADNPAGTHVATLIASGAEQIALDRALAEMAASMGWDGSFVTPVTAARVPNSPAASARVTGSSNPMFDGTTWGNLPQQGWLRTDWVGSTGQVFAGRDGTMYTIWAARPQWSLPWKPYQVGALIAATATWLLLATWLYLDVLVRQQPKASGWLALGLVGGPVALAIWLISRPVEGGAHAAAILCPACGGADPTGTTFCVRCGEPLRICPECQAPVAPDWTHCGACGAHLVSERRPDA